MMARGNDREYHYLEKIIYLLVKICNIIIGNINNYYINSIP